MRVFPVSWSILLLLLFFASSVRAEEYLDSGNWGPDAPIEPEAEETPKEAVKEEENEEKKEDPKPEEKEEKPPEKTLEPAPAKPAPPSPSSDPAGYEKEWEDVEYDIFDEIIPFEKRIALLKKFMAAHPGDHPHKKEAEYYLPLLEQHKEPSRHPFDKKRVPESKQMEPPAKPYNRNQTEWVGLRLMGGYHFVGGMLSIVTLRYHYLYWTTHRMYLAGCPDGTLAIIIGTQFGLQFQLDRYNIHELRAGAGLMGGISLGRRRDEHDPALGFYLPIVDLELNYLYRIKRHLALEAGLVFLLPTTDVAKSDYFSYRALMGFVGVRF